jgi:DNA-binding NarL/FixJ family response regulator
MRILIADDMPKVRAALQLLLKQFTVLDVVGTISRFSALVGAVQVLHPDLILLDWELAGEFTYLLIADLQRLEYTPSIVALSSEPEARDAALAAGADAFISKSDPPEQVLTTLLAMAAQQPE